MEAFIYDAVRTVRGKGNNKGALLGVTPTELVKQTMVHLKDKHNIDTTLVEDIILGCVTQVMDQAANIAKSAAQAAQYGDHMCGVTLNRFCGSGLESINQASAYIKSGYKDLIIAGGVECMSRVKMGSDGGGMFIDPNLAIPGNIIPQGISADLIASKLVILEKILTDMLLNLKKELLKPMRIIISNPGYQLRTIMELKCLQLMKIFALIQILMGYLV